MTLRKDLDVADHYWDHIYIPEKYARVASELYPIFIAPANVSIVKVEIIPARSVTGQNTNTTHLNLQNRGTAGTGTAELAAYDLTSGNNLTQSVPKVLYNPASPLDVATGVILAIQCEKVGGGLFVPALFVRTTYKPQ